MADEDFTPEELELLDEMIADLKAINQRMTDMIERDKNGTARFNQLMAQMAPSTTPLNGKTTSISNVASAGEKNSCTELVLIDPTPLKPSPSEAESTMVMEQKDDQLEELVLQPFVLINQQTKFTSSTFVPGVFISNRLLDLYTKCGSLVDAQKVFDEMGNRDLCHHWVIMTGLDSIEPILVPNDEHQLLMLATVSPRLPPKPPDISYATLGFAHTDMDESINFFGVSDEIQESNINHLVVPTSSNFSRGSSENTRFIDLQAEEKRNADIVDKSYADLQSKMDNMQLAKDSKFQQITEALATLLHHQTNSQGFSHGVSNSQKPPFQVSGIIDDLDSAKIVLDSTEEEAGRIVRELLQQGNSPSDSMDNSEVKVLKFAMVPFQSLQAYGVTVDAACPGKKAGDVCRTVVHHLSGHQTYSETHGHNFALNATFDDIDAKSYDGLVLPSGRSPENLAHNPAVVELVTKFASSKKTLASICLGELILAAAGVAKGRKYTAFPAVRPVLVASGAQWVEPDTMSATVVDGNLITAATYADYGANHEHCHVSNLAHKGVGHIVCKGTGGRSSVSGIVAAVFGETGFLGRYTVQQLAKMGSQVLVPFRSYEDSHHHLKLKRDLGQILPMKYNPRDENSIKAVVAKANVVINLTGRGHETRIFSFEEVQPSLEHYASWVGEALAIMEELSAGIATLTMMLLSQFIFYKNGWDVAANITPTVLLLMGVGFFSLILFGGPTSPIIVSSFTSYLSLCEKWQPMLSIIVCGNDVRKQTRLMISLMGPIAYKLLLSPTATIYPILHVSALKPCKGSHYVPYRPWPLTTFELGPLLISQEVLQICKIKGQNQDIPQVLMRGKELNSNEATWENLNDILLAYPNLEDKVNFKGEGIVMNANSTNVKPKEITERMAYGAAKSNQ